MNPVTLRAWERRYGLLEPVRSDSGRRLYTRSDVERIQEIVQLIDQGVPPSRVMAAISPRDTAPIDADAVGGAWNVYIERMISGVVAFDDTLLDEVYNEVMALYPVDVVTRRLLTPMLRLLGQRWESSGEGAIAEEHFFAVYTRNKLGARFHHGGPPGRSANTLVAACLPGELHDIGLLLFCLNAKEQGWRIVVLGANTPLTELPLVVSRTHADAIVLSGSTVANDADFAAALGDLCASTSLRVFVGGPAAARFSKTITRAGAFPVGDDMASGLRHIQRILEGERR